MESKIVIVYPRRTLLSLLPASHFVLEAYVSLNILMSNFRRYGRFKEACTWSMDPVAAKHTPYTSQSSRIDLNAVQ